MQYSLDWLYDPSVFQVNREKAHSDHDFSDADGLLRQSLNGVWKFAYAENPESRTADFYRTDYPLDTLDDIRVPGHIQLQGWGRCQYVNNYYPWEGHEQVKAPDIPRKTNPVGSYVKTFTLEDNLKNKTCFVSFQGVENAFYVWINGEFVGYSEDSFTPSEFNITPYLREGENRIAVEVYKYSTASWLEDQDFWRFSGIFRDVYLYAIPEVHVRDMKITADYDHLTGAGTLGAELDIIRTAEVSGEVSVKMTLADADGTAEFETISALKSDKCCQTVGLDKVAPWSAESPYLYTLTVQLIAADGTVIETASTKVGFRTFAMVDGVMRLNGKRIIFKGVNRHEFSAERGRSITEGDMQYDIRLLKQNNINAVRTSHYPNNSMWYRLCDEYGIYLIDESNLETHGAWLEVPNSLPEWRGAVVDRAISMYERDKNHPSVLIWSCGNESYADDNIAAMSEFFHSADSRRLVHYEGVFHNRKYDYISDMESRMYAKPCEIAEYLEQNTGKPYLSCEYMHAMGNSLGGMKLYTDLEDKYEGYQGGFIWDYIDQALWLTDDESDRTLAVGGDFSDRNTDYGFCTNGLIYADRTPSPKLREAKALYSNIRITVENGVATVENRNLFIDTSAYDFVAILQKNGEVTATDIFRLNVAPGEKGSAEIRLARPTESGEYAYTVSCVLAESTIWADAGHSVACAQEIVSIEAPEFICEMGNTVIVYGDFSIGVHGEGFSMLFDKKEFGISSLVYDGREYITRAPKVSFWRAPTDNDTGAGYPTEMAQWLIAGRNAKYHADRFISEEKDDHLELTYHFTAPTVPSFDYKVIYRAYYDGRLGVRAEYPGAAGLPDIPVFAMDFKLPKAYDRFTYYGMGPDENYIDRANGAKLGLYGMTAAENLSGYLNPQECGNRTGVRYVSVINEEGTGIRFDHTAKPFEMSVLPYSAYELDNATHLNELPEVQYTWVRIAAKQMGVGGDDSWGAPVHDEYKIPAAEPMALEFIISPSNGQKK